MASIVPGTTLRQSGAQVQIDLDKIESLVDTTTAEILALFAFGAPRIYVAELPEATAETMSIVYVVEEQPGGMEGDEYMTIMQRVGDERIYSWFALGEQPQEGNYILNGVIYLSEDNYIENGIIYFNDATAIENETINLY